MTATFVDTSAFYALLDADDAGHSQVSQSWRELLASDILLVTSNYVLVETCALLQSRIGIEAARAFQEDIVPVLEVHWINETTHHAAASALLAVAKRNLSLVDCCSFEVMRQGGLQSALSLDRHFEEHGFTTLPRKSTPPRPPGEGQG